MTGADEAVDAAVASLNPDAFAPMIRKAVEGIYEQLLGDVQDYLTDNAQFNIKSHISTLERDNAEQRARIVELSTLLGEVRGVLEKTLTFQTMSEVELFGDEAEAIAASARTLLAKLPVQS